ncbi:hypothetical protein, partial [Aeromonas veronii]|uniref:hypothetical protein n=1 Tax=Aeromonas veronii TaxID=654 RepID=UPI00406D180C
GRLVPCDNFDAYAISSEEPGGIIETYPQALLEILLRLLPIDVNRWPYSIGAILDRIARTPEVSADARLMQLKRMLGS